MYEETDNIYCYPGTKVLINKFGIKDKEKLEAVELDLAGLRILELKDNPIKGSFDLEHLKSIHKYIFQDIYNWAGQLRTIEISKGIWFARSDFIISEGQRIFNELKDENYISHLPFDKFCKKLAYYKAEINMLHPFREGNGRAIREFVRSLAEYNGYELDFSTMDKNQYIKAMVQSSYDTEPLKELFANNMIQVEKANIRLRALRKKDRDWEIDR